MFIEHNNYQFKYFTEQSKDKWQLKKTKLFSTFYKSLFVFTLLFHKGLTTNCVICQAIRKSKLN